MSVEFWCLFGAAVLGLVHMSAASFTFKAQVGTQYGGMAYLAGRCLFLPLYAAGVPWIRTFSWNLATAGLVTVMGGALVS
jgi:uncharacterized MAPEG superfamily protein